MKKTLKKERKKEFTCLILGGVGVLFLNYAKDIYNKVSAFFVFGRVTLFFIYAINLRL